MRLGTAAAAALLARADGLGWMALHGTRSVQGFARAAQVLAADAEVQSRDIARHEERTRLNRFGALRGPHVLSSVQLGQYGDRVGVVQAGDARRKTTLMLVPGDSAKRIP